MRSRLLVSTFLASIASACGYDDGPLDAGTSVGSGVRSDARAAVDARPATPACSNGLDDDCDGLTDLAGGDPGCATATDADERGPGNACDDGIDNDADGVRDYVRSGCGTVSGDPGCTSPADFSELDTPTP